MYILVIKKKKGVFILHRLPAEVNFYIHILMEDIDHRERYK